jgi:hypothetical protein
MMNVTVTGHTTCSECESPFPAGRQPVVQPAARAGSAGRLLLDQHTIAMNELHKIRDSLKRWEDMDTLAADLR